MLPAPTTVPPENRAVTTGSDKLTLARPDSLWSGDPGIYASILEGSAAPGLPGLIPPPHDQIVERTFDDLVSRAGFEVNKEPAPHQRMGRLGAKIIDA